MREKLKKVEIFWIQFEKLHSGKLFEALYDVKAFGTCLGNVAIMLLRDARGTIFKMVNKGRLGN